MQPDSRSWTVVEIDSGWSTLRRGPFLYTVPTDRLPPDVTPGAELHADSSLSEGYPKFTEGPSGAGGRRAVLAG